MSLRLRLANTALRAFARPWLRRVRTPAELRRAFDRAGVLLFRNPRVRLKSRGESLDLTPAAPRPGAAMLYLHGGGYVAGSPWLYRQFAARLAQATGLRVIVPAYRLAPEHPLPAALDDALAAWDRLVGEGLAPALIVLAGDSAGGGLALSLLAALCARGTPPAAVVAFSPWTDLTGAGASLVANAARDPLLPAERMAHLTALALGGVPARDPRLSPLFAAFPGAPPVLIQVGSTEILRDDSVRMAARLTEAGAEVDLEIWPDCPHVWHLMGWLPEARRALDRVAAFLDRALRASLPPAGS